MACKTLLARIEPSQTCDTAISLSQMSNDPKTPKLRKIKDIIKHKSSPNIFNRNKKSSQPYTFLLNHLIFFTDVLNGFMYQSMITRKDCRNECHHDNIH